MQPVETVLVRKEEVSCDGGEGPQGHPLIYLTFGKSDKIDCPYCGKRFVLEKKTA